MFFIKINFLFDDFRFNNVKEYEKSTTEAGNTDKYRNRGGQLQQELRQYNANKNRLVKLETELSEKGETAQLKYMGHPILEFIRVC